jgi:hypothetical protein
VAMNMTATTQTLSPSYPEASRDHATYTTLMASPTPITTETPLHGVTLAPFGVWIGTVAVGR